GVTSPRENLKSERDAPPAPGGGPGGGRGGTTQVPSPVDLRLDGARVKRFDVMGPAPDISKLVVGGPYNPTGRGDTPSLRTIFTCVPGQAEAWAGTILTAVTRRAFRRPVTRADVDPLLAFFRKDGRDDFDSGIQSAIEAMLVSPDFLFRVEQDPKPA